MSILGLTIGKLARQSGVNVETVRYYQRMGLIQEPAKPDQGYRNYSQQHIQQIRFIKRAQILGFSLKEIQEFLHLHKHEKPDLNDFIEAKLQDIELRIQDLQSMKIALNEFRSTNSNNKESILEVFA